MRAAPRRVPASGSRRAPARSSTPRSGWLGRSGSSSTRSAQLRQPRAGLGDDDRLQSRRRARRRADGRSAGARRAASSASLRRGAVRAPRRARRRLPGAQPSRECRTTVARRSWLAGYWRSTRRGAWCWAPSRHSRRSLSSSRAALGRVLGEDVSARAAGAGVRQLRDGRLCGARPGRRDGRVTPARWCWASSTSRAQAPPRAGSSRRARRSRSRPARCCRPVPMRSSRSRTPVEQRARRGARRGARRPSRPPRRR